MPSETKSSSTLSIGSTSTTSASSGGPVAGLKSKTPASASQGGEGKDRSWGGDAERHASETESDSFFDEEAGANESGRRLIIGLDGSDENVRTPVMAIPTPGATDATSTLCQMTSRRSVASPSSNLGDETIAPPLQMGIEDGIWLPRYYLDLIVRSHHESFNGNSGGLPSSVGHVAPITTDLPDKHHFPEVFDMLSRSPPPSPFRSPHIESGVGLDGVFDSASRSVDSVFRKPKNVLPPTAIKARAKVKRKTGRKSIAKGVKDLVDGVTGEVDIMRWKAKHASKRIGRQGRRLLNKVKNAGRRESYVSYDARGR